MPIVIDSLDFASFAAAAAELDGIADRLGDAVSDGCARLAEIAADTAMEHVKVDTGNLKSSISWRRTEDGAEVSCSAPYAAFVEFGTGIVGAGSPLSGTAQAAMSRAGYVPDGMGHGDEGWTYEKDGEFRHTYGQAGAGFMSAGADEARSRMGDVLAEEARKAAGSR